jgi:hypothetical protein
MHILRACTFFNGRIHTFYVCPGQADQKQIFGYSTPPKKVILKVLQDWSRYSHFYFFVVSCVCVLKLSTFLATMDINNGGEFPSPTSVAGFDRLETLQAKRLAIHQKRVVLQRKILEASNRSNRCASLHAVTHDEQDVPLEYSDDEEEDNANPEEHQGKYALELPWEDSAGEMGEYTGPLNERTEPHGAEGLIRYYDDSEKLVKKYDGDWKDGKKCGYGIQTWASGSVYEGNFESDQLHGRGIFRWAQLGDVYEGEWSHDIRHGQGIQIFCDGSKYHGKWHRGAMEGRGVFESTDGSMYEGKFRAGEKHGIGLQRWKNGKLYKGSFFDGKQHGRGTLTFSDGRRYVGDFVNNQMHGTCFLNT